MLLLNGAMMQLSTLAQVKFVRLKVLSLLIALLVLGNGSIASAAKKAGKPAAAKKAKASAKKKTSKVDKKTKKQKGKAAPAAEQDVPSEPVATPAAKASTVPDAAKDEDEDGDANDSAGDGASGQRSAESAAPEPKQAAPAPAAATPTATPTANGVQPVPPTTGASRSTTPATTGVAKEEAAANAPAPVDRPAESEAIDAPPEKIGLIIGLSGGIAAGFSPPLGLAPQFALEVGYRLPFLGQALGISVEPTFMLFLAQTSAGARTEGTGIVIPVLLSLNLDLGPGVLRVLGGVSIANMNVKTVDSLGTSTDTTWVFGAQGSLGYWFNLPFGAVFAVADFKALPYAALSANKLYLGVGGRLGYALMF